MSPSPTRPLLALFGAALLSTACTTPKATPVEAPHPYAGTWAMATETGDGAVDAVLTLGLDDAGTLAGTWRSQGHTMPLLDVSAEGTALAFERELPGGERLRFTGAFEGEELVGAWTGAFGELPSRGRRGEGPTIPDLHSRPIVERDGLALLWAKETVEGEAEWFDVTDARIDPKSLQFGIGKDAIPSIDAPEFVAPDDPRLAERGITPGTSVLGVHRNGIARAYPVEVMDLLEVVNDDFGGEAFAVLW